MSDRYAQLVNLPAGRAFATRVGLPIPTPLERWNPGGPVLSGTALLGAAPGGRLAPAITKVLAEAKIATATDGVEALRSAAAAADLDAKVWNAEVKTGDKYKALIFDATGITETTGLTALHTFFHPAFRLMAKNGRVLVLGTAPEHTQSVGEATAQRSLEGFTRSLGKETRGAGTVQLVYVQPGAEEQIGSTLRFFLSPKSAFVSGQVVRVTKATKAPTPDWEKPLAGKVALVTGASRGIGAAIAAVLARDGAHVVGLDVPPLEGDLKAVTAALGGSHITADVTSPSAPEEIRRHLVEAHGGVDIVVHNAGVTRDKTIAGMDADRWNLTLDINLESQERIDAALLEGDGFKPGGRIVSVSSMSGIAGNHGQTNYATSKAGVIGRVQAIAPVLAKQKITINAVAPGFIETQMTDAMPLTIREAGRRMSSLSQGGLPVDVAETIAWFASPASGGVTGNVVRVCGQNLLGA